VPAIKDKDTFPEELLPEKGPVVDILGNDLHIVGVEVAERRPDLHYVEDDLIYLQHAQSMGATQFISFPLAALQFQSIDYTESYITLFDWLLFGKTIIVDWNELVPSEVELLPDDGGKIVIHSEDRAGPENCDIGEYLLHCLFSLMLGGEVERGRVGLCSCC